MDSLPDGLRPRSPPLFLCPTRGSSGPMTGCKSYMLLAVSGLPVNTSPTAAWLVLTPPSMSAVQAPWFVCIGLGGDLPRMRGALPSLFSQQAHQATALSWNCCRQASSQGPRVRRQLCCPLVPSSSLPRYTRIVLSSLRKSSDLYNVFPFWLKAQGWGRGVDHGLPPPGSTCMPFPPRTLLLNPHRKAQS